MKIKLILVTVTAICLCLLLPYGSLAYYTTEDTAHNVITTMGVDIEVQEWTKDDKGNLVPFPEVGVGSIYPDTTVTKIVEVKNTGSASAWVRVEVEKSVVLANGEAGDTGLLKIDFNDADWTYKGGYYYYNSELKPGETTPPLFRDGKVTFDKSMDNLYKKSVATVTVTVYATQTANNGESALDEAVLWPAASGGELSAELSEEVSA